MASQRPHICTQWSHFLQQNSLNGLISLASHSLSAWFTEYISPQIYHTIHSMQRICTDSQCAWPCVCVAVFFTTSFLFQSLASFSAYLCVPIQCVVFDWNYIYIWSAAAMPFSKPQLESIQLFCDFKTNATIVYQAKRNVAREQNRSFFMIHATAYYRFIHCYAPLCRTIQHEFSIFSTTIFYGYFMLFALTFQLFAQLVFAWIKHFDLFSFFCQMFVFLDLCLPFLFRFLFFWNIFLFPTHSSQFFHFFN